ncbi:MAG: glycosyltransferase, partial [Treponema sp.]|nr:glycosyltransferase [Treponema sp.]
MKILMVHKFLYETGGAETYMLRLGEHLQSIGHQVQYFGMEEERNIAGNKWNILTKNVNFHKKSLETLLYPFKIIYSIEARRKMKRLLRLFKPDIVHMNNINYQLTPSIIYEVKKNNIPIVMTAHDYQCICPSHSLYQAENAVICEKCISSGFSQCIKNNCIHGSKLRSILGCIESILYHSLKTYSLIDKIICPSAFLETKLLTKEVFRGKTITMHNFIQKVEKAKNIQKGNYVLYFGRYSREKGISTLLEACRRIPEIQFVFAGGGPVENLVNDAQKNTKN